LEIKPEKNLILIQTDKSIYQPGDKIQFRVLILDSDTKPIKTDDPVTVFFEDADRNRVKQFDQVELKTGVFQGELQLSDSPVLGKWILKVEHAGDFEKQMLEIKKLVQEHFEVKVEVPSHVLKRNGIIPVTVSATDPQGIPIEGKATITCNVFTRSSKEPNYTAKRMLKVSGKRTENVDVLEDLKMLDDRDEEYVQITVNFKDGLTGRTASNIKWVTVHKFQYRLQIFPKTDYFKPGLDFEAALKITRFDGNPVLDTVNPVNIAIISQLNKEAKTNNVKRMTETLDEFGMIKIKMEVGIMVESLKVQAFYIDLHTSVEVPKFELFGPPSLVDNELLKFKAAEVSYLTAAIVTEK
jgi:CD109 antigen